MPEPDPIAELLAQVTGEHQQVATLSDACWCGAGDLDTIQPHDIASRRHRSHLAKAQAAALRAAGHISGGEP